jgi:hypothetical protein
MTGRDVIIVEDEAGEEVQVFNHASVVERHYVNSVNGYETFEPVVSKGDSMGGERPDAITERLARVLYDEFGYKADEHDIRVIDPEDENVTVL